MTKARRGSLPDGLSNAMCDFLPLCHILEWTAKGGMGMDSVHEEDRPLTAEEAEFIALLRQHPKLWQRVAEIISEGKLTKT